MGASHFPKHLKAQTNSLRYKKNCGGLYNYRKAHKD